MGWLMKQILLACFAFAGLCHAEEWQPLFNGRDLAGWSGDPRLWSVADGVIIGVTDDAERKTKANTFLVREGMEPDDFTLEFTARVTGKNNSGVQYRSRRPEDWVLKGYQFDLHPAKEYLGMLYEEGGRGIACKRGQKVSLKDKPEETGKIEIADVKLEDWNTYRIETSGNILKHFVNGKLAAEINDIHPEKRSLKGFIGLQLHAGPPMKAEFKDIRWKPMKAAAPDAKDKTGSVKMPPGFKLEQLYQVPKEQGSWVAMTKRADGSLYCSDQYGVIYKVRPGAGALQVEALPVKLGGAHGLLWHEGVLWVAVGERQSTTGVWKVTDTDGDGEPDKPELVKAIAGSGEHGVHSLVASPDNKWIYLVCGNHTNPIEFDSSVVPKVWQEDQLLTRRPDSRGHATGRMAPGGWVARFTPDAKHWELFSIGYRNAFDIAFNEHGDLFTYDADMEWDLGMPWYRPTRICHVTPGSEFGWRYGTGKWPDVYEDSMPSQLDIGPGSPTGMVSGLGARFPPKYQRAVFAFDWTFATIYAIHFTPDGHGYSAEREEFLAGSGLPLTDGQIGSDGALYFLTGGRRSGSALWRVSYTGEEKIEPVAYQTKELKHLDPVAALQGIASPNRVTRHQARVALELQGAGALESALGSATQPWPVITAAIGLARTGTAEHATTILTALNKLDWSSLDSAQQVNWLRAAGLVFARHGKPADAVRTQILSKIDAAFPSNNQVVDRELCRMLSYLEAPGIVSRTLDLMDAVGPSAPPDWLELAKRNHKYGSTVEAMIANLPPTQVIHYIYCLREVKGPWSESERRRFFAWFPTLLNSKGGASYGGFITDLRNQTLANATPEERKWLEVLILTTPPPNVLANLPRPKGPGRAWTVADVEKIAAAGFAHANRDNGKLMFQAALCAACHRFGGEGGAAGPDLSTVAGRFTARDLAESILEPGKVVSDQYEFTQITRTDGSSIIGKIVEVKEGGATIVATNPFDFTQTMTIPAKSIREKTPSPVSPMPAGLINSLNEQELRDLLAYLLGS
jgi:putative heme-binding domain-containing protein